MSMQICRTVLATLPANLKDVHPMAIEGTLYDSKRANDKHVGKGVIHYAQKGQLYFVKTAK